MGFKVLFLWYCLPGVVSLEGLPGLLLRGMEGFTDFAGVLVLMCFLGDNLASMQSGSAGQWCRACPINSGEGALGSWLSILWPVHRRGP